MAKHSLKIGDRVSCKVSAALGAKRHGTVHDVCATRVDSVAVLWTDGQINRHHPSALSS